MADALHTRVKGHGAISLTLVSSMMAQGVLPRAALTLAIVCAWYCGIQGVFAKEKSEISISYTPWLEALGIKDIDLIYIAGYKKLDKQQAVDMIASEKEKDKIKHASILARAKQAMARQKIRGVGK